MRMRKVLEIFISMARFDYPNIAQSRDAGAQGLHPIHHPDPVGVPASSRRPEEPPG